MSRPGRKATGQVLKRGPNADGSYSYAIRFRVNGKRRLETLGTTAEGWNETRARDTLDLVLAQIKAGVWRPPEAAPSPAPVDEGAPPTLGEFTYEWYAQWLADAPHDAPRQSKTIEACEWELGHLRPALGDLPLSALDGRQGVRVVDEFRQTQLGKGLSARSVNKLLSRLGAVLDLAVEHGHIEHNPLQINPRRRRVATRSKDGAYLDRAHQIEAVLEAAGDLDRERHSKPYRRALMAVLVLGGLRIDEALSLRWRDVDLASGRLLIQKSKTAAGVRHVDLLPALRDELLSLKARAGTVHPTAWVFPTRTGNKRTADNARSRIFKPTIDRASAKLVADGGVPLPDDLTPHAMRRTFASLLFALGRTPPEVMEQIGHTNASLTLRLYAKAIRREDGENEALRQLAGLSTDAGDWAQMGTNPAPARSARTPTRTADTR